MTSLKLIAVGLISLGALISFATSRSVSAADVLTQRYNPARTGSTTQPGLNQATLLDPRWGEIRRIDVSDLVYAQPLYVENLQIGENLYDILFVAARDNSIHAFDAVTFEQKWKRFLKQNDASKIYPTPEGAAPKGCDALSPAGMGIEATPVISADKRVLYVSYRRNLSSGGADALKAEQRLIAVNTSDGSIIADVPVIAPGAPDQWTKFHRSRAGLLLDHGVVYVAMASRCEDPGQEIFHGWIIGFDASTLKTSFAFSPTADGSLLGSDSMPIDGGGVWQGGVGLVADGNGNIFAATGNRRTGLDSAIPADQVPTNTLNYANSVIKLSKTIDLRSRRQVLKVVDYFTPYRKIWMDEEDLDLGASGPVLIPQTPYLLVGGKTGMIYVLNGDDLGKLDNSHAWSSSERREFSRSTRWTWMRRKNSVPIGSCRNFRLELTNMSFPRGRVLSRRQARLSRSPCRTPTKSTPSRLGETGACGSGGKALPTSLGPTV